MEYANRDTEYGIVKEYLENGVSPIIINAYHACGITSFVKNKLKDVCASIYGSNVFYIDVSSQKSLPELLLSCLISSGHLTNLQKMMDRKFGGHDSSLLSSAMEGIPYAGPFLGRLFEQKSAVPVYTGAYSSAIEELLTLFFHESLKDFKSLIIVDSVELLTESSYKLLCSLMLCESVQCILIKTSDTIQYDKLENYFYDNNIDFSATVYFDKPQIKLIKELGMLYGITVSHDEALEILQSNNHNIHTIIKQIRSVKSHSPQPELTACERAVISILNIWSGSIPEDILYEIVSLSESFSLNAEKTYIDALRSLQGQRIVVQSSQGWELSLHHDPQIQEIISNFADQLYYKNIVYQILSREDYGKYNIELRYQLSKELNCSTAMDARLYLRQLIITGKAVPQETMQAAQLVKGEYSDCLLASIELCRERKYQEALEWIDSIPNHQNTDAIHDFRAILLNRTRHSDEAEKALLRSLERNGTPASQNLLRAFLISTYIHMERLPDAQKAFIDGCDLFPNAPMHGYLIRNATSAYSDYREELYSCALADFKRDNDDFGYYSTLCNQGYALCKNGNAKDGLILLEKAREGMEKFPSSNLHIIYNDLGLCHLLLGNYNDAYHFLLLSYNLGQNTMPRIYAIINLACTEAVMGKTKQACERMKSIESTVESHKLDRVRQQYYINRLLIEYLSGNRKIGAIIEMSGRYSDRYHPEQTRRAIRFYKHYLKSNSRPQNHRWKELFSPCGLVYWYMDPLKILPEGII